MWHTTPHLIADAEALQSYYSAGTMLPMGGFLDSSFVEDPNLYNDEFASKEDQRFHEQRRLDDANEMLAKHGISTSIQTNSSGQKELVVTDASGANHVAAAVDQSSGDYAIASTGVHVRAAPNNSARAQFASYTISSVNTNQRLVSASAGYMSALLGLTDPSAFSTAQAALHDFVDSTESFFSPFSWTEGASNPFTKHFGERLEAFNQYVLDPAFGTTPSGGNAYDRAFSQLGDAVGRGGGFVGVTNIQTQSYSAPTYFLGIPFGGGWKNDAPIQRVITNGPLAAGIYASPGAASYDAGAALRNQLQQMGYVRPPQPSF